MVSSPSRPTVRNAVSVSAPAPMAAARSTSPRRWADRVAAVRRIQKIIPVTRKTARTLSSPPTASCPVLVSTLTEKVRMAANAPERVTAPSTPSQTGAVDRAGSPVHEAPARAARDDAVLAHGRQQDGHDEPGLKPLAESDQQVGYAVRPSHGD